MKADLSLYLIADTAIETKMPFFKVVEEAIAGGVTVVQLRCKNKSRDEAFDLAHSLRNLTRSYKVPFFINDNVEMVLSVDADGVHLGQTDMKIEEARKIIGSEKIIGLSAHTMDEASEAEKKEVDYIGVGTVYPTSSKSDIRGIIGTDGLRDIRNKINIPVVAIGGISSVNAASVMATGVNGVAIIAAIMCADSPRQAAQEIKSVIEKYTLRGGL